MHADRTKLRQVLFNLLSNAAKFTENGSIYFSVERHNSSETDWIHFKVSDTGIGLSSEQISKLFVAFAQADTSVTRKYGGTGLGLAISRQFCQMMGGDIVVESALGKGSSFTAKIPAWVPERKLQKPAAAVEALPDQAETVLVIDDDPVAQDLIQRALAREGCRAEAAYNGDEGLLKARRLRPKAIMLDVIMPGSDGWTVLSELKADPEIANIPVVMLTIVDEKNLGFSRGANGYLIKPVDHQQLALILAELGFGMRAKGERAPN